MPDIIYDRTLKSTLFTKPAKTYYLTQKSDSLNCTLQNKNKLYASIILNLKKELNLFNFIYVELAFSIKNY